MKSFRLFAATALLGVASTAMAGVIDYLTVVSSSDNKVMLFDPHSGALINDSFIDLNPLEAGTPQHAIQVGSEIWVSDQIRDRVDRFSLGGTYLSTIGGIMPGGGLDNIRGMRVVGNEVWVTNAGTQNDAPGNAIVRFGFDGSALGSFAVDGSSWFITEYNSEYLISFSGAQSRIDRFDANGVFLGNFNTPGEISFIQQTHVGSNGNLYAAAFSGGAASGVYEFDADGTNLGVVPGTSPFGPRGVWELGNGNIMWTNGSGVFISNPLDGDTVQVASGQFRYIDLVSIPAPGAFALIGLAGLGAARRRRTT